MVSAQASGRAERDDWVDTSMLPDSGFVERMASRDMAHRIQLAVEARRAIESEAAFRRSTWCTAVIGVALLAGIWLGWL